MGSRLQTSRTVEAGRADSEARRPRGAHDSAVRHNVTSAIKQRRTSQRARRIPRHVMYVGIYFCIPIFTRKSVFMHEGGISSSEAPTVAGVEFFFFFKALISADHYCDTKSTHTHTQCPPRTVQEVSCFWYGSRFTDAVGSGLEVQSFSAEPRCCHPAVQQASVVDAFRPSHAPPHPATRCCRVSEVGSSSGRAAGPAPA